MESENSQAHGLLNALGLESSANKYIMYLLSLTI